MAQPCSLNKQTKTGYVGSVSVHEASNTASGLATVGVEEYQLPIGATVCLFPDYLVKLYSRKFKKEESETYASLLVQIC